MTSEVMDSADPCPTEDALSTLLEYLVDPKLPSKAAARTTPAQLEQELIGKQIHAVVLLYNYYYRKEYPQLEFLGFENFCKLAVILRPALLAYLKIMQLSNDTELDNLEKELSLTEKMIMHACDISTSLDISINTPSTEGWPITKVAVFLVDSRKENCLLKFGSITEGVWSVIEKDVDLSNRISRITVGSENLDKKKKFIRKPLKNVAGTDESGLQQLAFSVIKEVTGINQSDLLILERHNVYSTSKEKASACFYIVQCTQPNNNQDIQIPIKDALNRVASTLPSQFSGLSFNRKGPSSSPQVQLVGSDTINVNSSERIENHCMPKALKSSHTEQYKNDEFYDVDLPDDFDGPCKMEADNSFVVHTQTMDKGIDVASKVKPDSRHKMTSQHFNGSMDKIVVANSLKKQKISRDGPVASGNKYCEKKLSNQGGTSINGLALVEHQSNSNDPDNVRSVIASKDQELSQAALKVILSKRAKLCLQLRDLEDQIAQCDKNIQTILNGGEGDLALKIESLIEGCNDVCLGSLIQETQHGMDKCSTPLIRSTRLLPNKQNTCQELDDLCSQKNWILPTYRVSALDGGFQATVSVKGTDYEYSISTGGDLRPHPHEARESAALLMLSELQSAG